VYRRVVGSVCERTYVVVDVERGDELRVVEDANCSKQHVVGVSVSVRLSVTACRRRQRVCLSVRPSVCHSMSSASSEKSSKSSRSSRSSAQVGTSRLYAAYNTHYTCRLRRRRL